MYDLFQRTLSLCYERSGTNTQLTLPYPLREVPAVIKAFVTDHAFPAGSSTVFLF